MKLGNVRSDGNVKKRCIITLQTSSEDIRKLFKSTKSMRLPCSIDENLSRDDLIAIMKRFRKEKFYKALLEILVGHSNVDDYILEDIIKNENDDNLLNDIATSGKCSERVLKILINSEHEYVQQHARLALIHIELANAKPQYFRELFQQYPGEKGIDIGVRVILASHPNTPKDIIEQLKSDEVDIVKDVVQNRLMKDYKTWEPSD